MMVDILDPNEGESIYDPACGTGGMLLGAIEHIVRKGGDPRTFYGKIYGQEKNLTTSAIARMNLVLHGIEDFQIAREDTLRSPAFTDSSTGGLGTFDCVIANPPFSLKEWGRELWEADPWSRPAFGMPPESYGDYAFVQHMIASMTRTGNGRMAVVLPQGALFRKAAEGKIRTALLKHDMIDAVIGLAPNLFYGTQLAGCIVILRRARSPLSEGTRSSSSTPQASSAKGGPRTSSNSNTANRSCRGIERSRRSKIGPRSRLWTRSKRRGGRSTSRATSCPHRRGHSAAPGGGGGVQDGARGRPRGRRPPAKGPDRGRVAAMSRQTLPATARELPLGRRHAPAWPRRCERLQAVHLPLMFFKRLSDVWDEDYRQALDETGDEGYATDTANDRFIIPAGAHWSDVRTAPRNVGRALLKRVSSHRGGEPGATSGRVRQCPVDRQGPASRRNAQEPHRALLEARPHPRDACPKTNSGTGTSTSSRSSPTTAATPRRSSTRTAPSCT